MAQKLIRRAIYPGTFDPVTNGHVSLIERSACMFDELIVAVSINAGKNTFFDFQQRIDLMTEVVEKLDTPAQLKVVGFDGLLAKFASDMDAKAIVRGLRAVSDFEYEFQMALMNRKLAEDIETVFLMPSLSWVYLSSTIVKDVAINRGDIAGLVPAIVKNALDEKIKK